MAVNAFYCVFFIAVSIGIFLFIRNRELNFAERCLFVLFPVAIPLCICGLINKLCEVPFFYWNEPRLAPIFGWHAGYSLYSGPGESVNDNAYGPLAALVYLPATLAHSPTIALLLAGAIAFILTCGPIFWFALRDKNAEHYSRPINLILVFVFIEFAFHNDALAYSMFNIHADAPALGFGALACGALLMYSKLKQRSVFFLTALFAALSVWAKQSQMSRCLSLYRYSY